MHILMRWSVRRLAGEQLTGPQRTETDALPDRDPQASDLPVSVRPEQAAARDPQTKGLVTKGPVSCVSLR